MKEYQDLRKKYGAFAYPILTLQVGDKLFSENKHSLVLSSIQVDLSCGLEASAAAFWIYNGRAEKRRCGCSNDAGFVQPETALSRECFSGDGAGML